MLEIDKNVLVLVLVLVVTCCRHEKETITNESVGRTQTNYAENRQIVDLC